MSPHYKAYLVVITMAAIAFWFARPVFTRFMADEDYFRRRNLWLCLTTSAFLIPNFWVHMGVASILVYRVAKKDPNPSALFLLMLLAIPPLEQSIPGFGILNYIFPLNHIRLLTIVILLPELLRIRSKNSNNSTNSRMKYWTIPDIFLLIYAFFQVFLYAPYSQASETARNIFLVVLDVLLPYYVLSRSCNSRSRIIEAMAAFALSAIIFGPLAVFETSRSWLLYEEMANHFNISTDIGGYLLRADILRASLTSGQSKLAFYLGSVVNKATSQAQLQRSCLER